MSLTLRDALPSEAALLSDIAHGSKAYWGYPPEWLVEWRDELTLTPDYVAGQRVVVCELGGAVAGLYALSVYDRDTLELDHLWVAPDHIGKGIGRFLMRHAVGEALATSATRLRILSDPNAEAFYKKMGARRVALEDAPVCGQSRQLPVMFLPLR